MQNLINFGPGEVPGDLFILRSAPCPLPLFAQINNGHSMWLEKKKNIYIYILSVRVHMRMNTVPYYTVTSASCSFAPSNCPELRFYVCMCQVCVYVCGHLLCVHVCAYENSHLVATY